MNVMLPTYVNIHLTVANCIADTLDSCAVNFRIYHSDNTYLITLLQERKKKKAREFNIPHLKIHQKVMSNDILSNGRTTCCRKV
jgi:hypothetical protein